MNHPLAATDDQLVPNAEEASRDHGGLEMTNEVVVRVEAAAPAAVRDQRGMVSAEWAVGIIAAIAIAGVLLAVVTSGPVEEALLKVILRIINAFTRGL